jgi:hypothetical protein
MVTAGLSAIAIGDVAALYVQVSADSALAQFPLIAKAAGC